MGAETNRRDFFNMSGASMLAALASKPAHAGVLSESVDQAGNASEKAGAALPTRPNIIPLHARRDARGQSGLLRNPVTRTPNFDRLAKEGTRFSNCHVQLYSYEDDPQEMHNRYGEPGVASVQSAL